MEEMRFYVKNLPPDLCDNDFKKYFHKFGDVFNISMKKNYGFFSAKCSLDHLETMLSKFNQKNWNGFTITLERSEKENFMEKLARERLSGNNNMPCGENFNSKRKRVFEKLDRNDNENAKVRAGVPMFSGTTPKKQNDVMASFNEFDPMWVDKEDTTTFSSFLKSDDVKTKQKNLPLTKNEKKLRDDERRRQSLANKAKEKIKQQSVIQTALSNLATQPKKIIFDSDDESKSNKINLFDDLIGDDNNLILTSKEHFEGHEGRKLLQLQNQFNNDERFKLDKRFLDDDTGVAEDKQKLPIQMIRYDPTKPLSNSKDDESSSKLKSINRFETPAPIVSNEKFYEVSEGIKASLQQMGSGFSLLETYGKKHDEFEPTTVTINDDEKIQKIRIKNPMLLDSSEDEEHLESSQKKWEPTINIPFGSRDNFFFTENDPLFSEAFEFMNKKNSEDAAKANENYDVTRKLLKKIFRDQILKRTKKTDMFKKKVGGMKKKVNTSKTNLNGQKFKR